MTVEVDPAGRTVGPGRPSPALLAAIRRHLVPLVDLAYRPRLAGAEHLPAPGVPFLLVANHSAGMGLAEIACLAALYARGDLGGDRPLAGFAHPIGFRLWPMRKLMRALGAVPSTYAAARETLAAGVPLVVFPGGDHETLRPVWRAGTVDFGGRKGFLRIAREARVPVVPMGIRGSHYTAPMLWRARWLAWALVLPKAMGINRWGVSVLGVAGAAALLASPLTLPLKAIATFLWLGSPLVFLPIVPWSIRFRIGPPLDPELLFDGAGELPARPVEAELARAYTRVVDAVQAELDRA